MAREPLGADETVPGEYDTVQAGNTGLLGRRSYLKLAGAATVAAAAAVGTASAEDSEQAYEEITLSAGERRVFTVGSGETFENKLIDCSANNARPVIIAKGTNWTIRNVAISGRITAQQPDSCFGVADTSGGESLMENIYLGDGAVMGSSSTHQTGIWVDPQHNGHLTMRSINVQGFPDNGIYASAPAGRGGGSVHIDNCYGANNWVSTYRLGSPGSRLTNSVFELTAEDHDGRGLWAWAPGPIEVENCHLNARGRHHAIRAGAHSGRTVVNVSDTEYSSGDLTTRGNSQINRRDGNGTDPESFLPEGVPETALDAAGASSGGEEDEVVAEELDHTIVFDGVGTNGVSQYELTVSGQLEPATDSGASIDEDSVIEDGSVSGSVATWRDAFRFSGDLEALSVDGDARVLVDGEPVDPGEYGGESVRRLTVVGRGVPSSYEFTVDGTVSEVSPDDDGATISGGSVESSIARGVDRYRFSGTLSDLTFTDGAAHVYLDSERIDPDAVGDEALLPHVIVIDGSDVSGSSTYSFTVDGSVVKSEYLDATIDEDDIIDGQSVRGSVSTWRDAYWFSGDVTDFSIEGDADVSVSYNVREH